MKSVLWPEEISWIVLAVSKKLVIIGLTGGIGMGKSATACLLRHMGIPVHDADAVVHAALSKGGAAVVRVGRLFPETLKRGAIDRTLLGRHVFHLPDQLQKLEKILHPIVRKEERAFLQAARRAKKPAVVLEIPLLFETGAEKRCDLILCVSAPRAIQKARVLARSGMTEEKFKAIVARQLPEAEKRRRADFVLPTGEGPEKTDLALRHVLGKLSLLPV